MHRRILCFAMLFALAPLARAQHVDDNVPITAADRHDVIENLATQLQKRYGFPDAGTKLAATMRERDASGVYTKDATIAAFGKHLANDLRTLGDDGHFNIHYDPNFNPPSDERPPFPDAAEVARGREEVAERGYGIDSIARLPGNVGYIEVRGFGPTELVAEAMSDAMTLLQGTDALIIDLRRNHGGEPNTVAHLMSHFFPVGDQRHLNDIYSRADDSTQQFWTNPNVQPRYGKPVYVLTSSGTFSGGEEFAYDMQTQKRATLVGETTGGGSNPGDVYPLGHGFGAFIPHSRSINPVTHTNWEHVGVKPDIAVPAADAKKVAQVAILRDLVEKATDPERKAELQEALSNVQSGKADAPVYALRR
ncbi:S41 family peptidase [Cognatilysobacter terrigena]|uniref:S41 family peptidase n=1 Tax=Cognatilysobacter terrigena TaxID=2488749 RepID=UPI00105FBFE9|nr:S41 family peptidase [Lysobacter terrigena]